MVHSVVHWPPPLSKLEHFWRFYIHTRYVLIPSIFLHYPLITQQLTPSISISLLSALILIFCTAPHQAANMRVHDGSSQSTPRKQSFTHVLPHPPGLTHFLPTFPQHSLSLGEGGVDFLSRNKHLAITLNLRNFCPQQKEVPLGQAWEQN